MKQAFASLREREITELLIQRMKYRYLINYICKK